MPPPPSRISNNRCLQPPLPPPSPWPEKTLIESIKTLSLLRRLSSAFAAYSLLLRRLPSLSSSSLLRRPISSLLVCAASLRSSPAGEQLHCHVITLGLHRDTFILPRLAALYAALNLLDSARAAAADSHHPLTWNLLISAQSRSGFWRETLLQFREMLCLGVDADEFAYPSVLKACGSLPDLSFGELIHGRIETSGLHSDLFVKNALVSMYAKCGSLSDARTLFDEMPTRDVVTWNSMISGYSSRGMWDSAFGLLELMPEGSLVNVVTWNSIIGGMMQRGNHVEALRLLSQIRVNGSGVDSVTLVIGLNASSRTGRLMLGKEIHGLAIRLRLDCVENLRNALITMYSRCNDMGRARFLFGVLESRSLVTWNAMIAGFALAGQFKDVVLLFQDMISSGVHPNYVTVLVILPLCARFADLHHGRVLHCYGTKHGLNSSRPIRNALIDMYTKLGRISAAQKIFDSMSDHDVVSYTSLIAGYGMKGEGITSLKLFDELIGRGIKPDHVTMVAVLSACSHSGFVARGQMIFEKMVEFYGIGPRLEHYSCMVHLYARAGLLKKAEEMLYLTPSQPTAAMLATLLLACLACGNKERGKRVANGLLEMRSDDPNHYVLVANMYAFAGCHQELARVRSMMKEIDIAKARRYSFLDLGNEIYRFLEADRYELHANGIYTVLEETEHMRDDVDDGSEEFGVNTEVG